MIPLLAALLWWPEWQAGYLYAFVLYCLMGFTDFFDGYLARSTGAVSKLGIFLDPIADKIMVVSVILVLAAMGVETELTRGAVRVSLGWTTTAHDVESLLNAWNNVVSSLLKKHATAA